MRYRPRRDLFEGDVAIIELRRRLAQTRGGMLPMLGPPTPAYYHRGSTFGSFVGYVGLLLVAATTAAAGGYMAGHLSQAIKTARLAQSGTARLQPVALTAVAHVAAPMLNPEPPGARAIATVAAAHRQADLPLPPPRLSDNAPKMRLGAELMAAGDVVAARVMFERVAEAGDAAGAFALAETYDPVVLRAMPLRGGITPDAGQARRWYEKARDMGSRTAPERIARLRGAAKK